MQVLPFLISLIFLTACIGESKKDFPRESDHSKPSRNRGNAIVQRFLQDKSGNLWFGTRDNGIYKYDGNTFHQFTINDGLDCNRIFCIMEGKDGKIWVGTEEGLCVYDGIKFSKVHIPLPINLPPNKNPYYQTHWVYSMLQAQNGKLWFVTIDGIYIYDGNTFSHFPLDEVSNGFLTNNDKVESILEDNAGNIWFGGRTNAGVFKYDGKTITHLKPMDLFQSGPQLKAHNWGWPQLQDKEGNIWFSNWGGAYKYDGNAFKSFTKNDGLPREVTRIMEDKNGNLWFGTADGLRGYDGKNFTHYKDGLLNPWIWEILEDTNGNIWVGTRDNGIYVFDGKSFINYSK